jgi:hypothetical protein
MLTMATGWLESLYELALEFTAEVSRSPCERGGREERRQCRLGAVHKLQETWLYYLGHHARALALGRNCL